MRWRPHRRIYVLSAATRGGSALLDSIQSLSACSPTAARQNIGSPTGSLKLRLFMPQIRAVSPACRHQQSRPGRRRTAWLRPGRSPTSRRGTAASPCWVRPRPACSLQAAARQVSRSLCSEWRPAVRVVYLREKRLRSTMHQIKTGLDMPLHALQTAPWR